MKPTKFFARSIAPSIALVSLLFVCLTPVLSFAEGRLNRVIRLDPLVLGDGEENDFNISRSEISIETGKLYMLPVEAKGYKEYRFQAPEFFETIWVRQVVVEDLEVHTTSIDALEFDDQGTMELWFVAHEPGEYRWSIEDFDEKGMQGVISVR